MIIKKYTKASDEYTTYTATFAQDEDGQMLGQELCEIDGETYISVDDTEPMPEQLEQITIVDVVLTDELRAKIKAASPHCKLIKSRATAKIHEHYPLEDRLNIAAIAGGMANGIVPDKPYYTPMMEQYRDFILSVNIESAEQYSALGL